MSKSCKGNLALRACRCRACVEDLLEANSRLTKERDELAQAFIDVFDEFFDSIAFARAVSLPRQQALHELRDRLREEASGE